MQHSDAQLQKARIKPFLGENFLLENDVAAELYHDYAAALPIIDYHCHLSPEDIANNRRFRSITEIWLEGDHYKWRAMRTDGVAERFITGDASDWEKFEKWAQTVPSTMRNPLFHWTHLELQRYFDVHEVLNAANARAVYERANDVLLQPQLTTQGILKKMNVEVVCTTDDPTDTLAAHRQYGQSGQTATKIYPAFRPDKAILIEREGFAAYIEKLAEVGGTSIRTYSDLLEVLYGRMDFFESLGCSLSDHGLERLYAADFTEAEADRIFQKRLDGKTVSPQEAELYQSAILFALSVEYARRGWTQQFHLGALRNNNSRLLGKLGPDTGFDSIGDFAQAAALSRFLDRLDKNDQLAQTILYNLNPADNEVFGTMTGNFNDGSVPGKVQWGSAWWFLDQKDGMEKQINALSNLGLLARFVGMLTDSRSFLSFPRHEYFRRILCNLIGRDVENGELPHDMHLLGRLVQDVCYHNARNYFKF
jgi:glucuronate isomerase